MKDMTKGSPMKTIVLFAIPMVLSSILQQCYNIADSIIAGNFAGVDALAAVGVSTPITQLFVGLGIGVSMGTGVIISQIFGSGDKKKLRTAIYTALIAGLVFALLLMLIGVLTSRGILELLKTPQNILSDADVYLSIYMWGVPFLILYNMANAIFNALGDSKKPLYFLIFSTVLNIALDLLFVAVFRWGVAGVAWATFIAQGCAALLAVLVLLLRTSQMAEKTEVFSFSLLKSIAYIGIPTMLQNAIVNVGNLFVAALVNSYGSNFIAGYSAALKINGFFIMVVITLGNAVATFAGQNIGAKQLERPGQGLKAGMTLNFIYVALATAVVWLFGRDLISLFVTGEATEEVFEAGVTYLRIVVTSSFFFIILNNTCAVSRAAGYMIAFTSTTLIDLVVRVASAYALNPVLGSASISWSVGLGWLVGAVMGAAFYLSGRWKKVSLIKE